MTWLNPYLLLGAVAWTAFAGLAGWQTGREQAQDACQAEKVTALTRAIRQAEAIATQDAEVLTANEVERERIRTVFQPIREEVIRYVSDHASATECLDPDGLRLWRAANAGHSEALPAAEPDYALSGFAPATLGQGPGPARESRGYGSAVPRLPRTPESAGRLGR